MPDQSIVTTCIASAVFCGVAMGLALLLKLATPDVAINRYYHGLPSCRLESLGLSEDVLDELGIHMVAFDRPGFGQSSPHVNRDYATFADDVQQLADHLGWERFFVVGVSGGGPYSWATAAYLPHRVRGTLIFSGAGPLGILQADERQLWEESVSGVQRRIAKAVQFPPFRWLLRAVGQTRLGGKQIYATVLRPLRKRATSLMAPVDQQCLAEHHPEYTSKVLPEAMLQESATPWLQELTLFLAPWPFNVSETHAPLRAATHLWHGEGDRQVPHVMSQAFKRLAPEAHLTILEGGGHFAYFVCSSEHQRQALTALLASAI